jgi:hypothetical protein
MQDKRRSGASYRAIEQWLRADRGIQMSFMGVKDVLLRAEKAAENH